MLRRQFFSLFSLLFFLSMPFLLNAQEEPAQAVRIEQIYYDDFPRVRAYVSVEDETGEPNLSLVKGNFTVKVDTQDPVESLNVDQFKQMEEPVHYVFFLTASGLMDGRPLAAQKKALLDFGLELREDDTLSAYMVAETAQEVFSYVSSDEIPEDVVQEITVLEDQAKIYDTLVSAVRKVEKDKTEEVIGKRDRVVFIIMSDGRDNESRFDLEQTGKIMGDSGIPLYSIGLKVLSEASLSLLDELAVLSGGFYYYTPSTDMLSENLEAMAHQILMSYVISFKVKGVQADDEYHQLMVQVDDKELSIQSFRNFLAYKAPFPRWLKIVLLILFILAIIALVLLVIFSRIRLRKRLGITKRRCPDCGRRMRDDWEFCPFCRYMDPEKNKRKARRKKKEKA
ncbi:MAG: hypothetical protein PQJ60_13485 [Spirochaetales bacterium]|nr:hypothetical protein [Spirochaetales bacterium]